MSATGSAFTSLPTGTAANSSPVDEDALEGLREAGGDTLEGTSIEGLREAALEESRRQALEHLSEPGAESGDEDVRRD